MYTLEAFLGEYKVVEKVIDIIPSAPLIQLPQNIGMIPVDGYLLRELEILYQGGTKVTRPEIQQFSPSIHPDFERMIAGVEKLAERLSYNGMVAYVEAAFTGGYGGHDTMIWENGKRVGRPGKNINDVLRLLNVTPEEGLDEFDTLGLGRYRRSSDWIKKEKS